MQNKTEIERWFEKMFSTAKIIKPKKIHYKSTNSAKSFIKKYPKTNIKYAHKFANQAKEVMVKITSKKNSGTSIKQVKNHLTYIGRNGNKELINENGIVLTTKEIMLLWSNENESVISLNNDNARKLTYNLVLSMPKNTNRIKFENACNKFLKKSLPNHQYISVIHDDTDHPHMHICLRSVNKDGERIRFNKKDIQSMRENFAIDLNSVGIPSKATERKKLKNNVTLYKNSKEPFI